MTTVLGPYIAEEIPEPWVHEFEDADGATISITGYDVVATWKVNGGTRIERAGTVVDGKAQITWEEGDFDVSGVMSGELTATRADDLYRPRERFVMRIRPARGGAIISS